MHNELPILWLDPVIKITEFSQQEEKNEAGEETSFRVLDGKKRMLEAKEGEFNAKISSDPNEGIFAIIYFPD